MQPGTRDDLRYAVVRCCIPGPGYIGMCKVFPRASDLQGFSKINGYAWSSCFRGWGGGGGGGGKGRRRRNSSGGCHCSAQPLDNANTPYSEAGWREARATNENSTEFETVRASDTYISREKRTRLCIEKGIDETNIYMCVYVYTYMYDAHNTELSIIHGSHDRWPAGIYGTRYVNWFIIASRRERIIQTISFPVAEIPRTESEDFRDSMLSPVKIGTQKFNFPSRWLRR